MREPLLTLLPCGELRHVFHGTTTAFRRFQFAGQTQRAWIFHYVCLLLRTTNASPKLSDELGELQQAPGSLHHQHGALLQRWSFALLTVAKRTSNGSLPVLVWILFEGAVNDAFSNNRFLTGQHQNVNKFRYFYICRIFGSGRMSPFGTSRRRGISIPFLFSWAKLTT